METQIKIAKVWDVKKKEYKFTLELKRKADTEANDGYIYTYIGIRSNQVKELMGQGIEVVTY